MRSIRYFLILYLLIVISTTYSMRFEGKTFLISPEIDLDNLPKIFKLKENKYNVEEDKYEYIFYRISEYSKKVMPKSFVSKLFDDGVFFPIEIDDVNYPAVLSNFFPKYSNNSSFEDYLYYDFQDKGGIYILFLSDYIKRETRFYYYRDPLESLQKFYVERKELINKNTPVILFCDLSYQNFRKVAEKADFIDYIIDYQDFEQGNIYGKKIRNIKRNNDNLYKMDLLFGNHGFLTFDFYEISLDKIDPSLFMKRIIDTRRFKVDHE